MKTDQAKTFLQKAIQHMPNDFALAEVRYHLRLAAQKLEHLEVKKQKREEVQKKATWYPSPGSLATIDQMLADEKARLEEIIKSNQKSPEPTEEDTLLG